MALTARERRRTQLRNFRDLPEDETAVEPEPEPEPTPTPEPTPAPDSGKDDPAACTEQLARMEAKLDKLLGLVNPSLLEG